MATLSSKACKQAHLQPLFSSARRTRQCGRLINVRFASGESSENNVYRPPAPTYKKTKPTSGTFKALPPNQLGHELFEEHSELNEVPLLTKSSITNSPVGSLARFPTGDKAPITTLGLPRKIFIEHRTLSKPFSVIRDSTVKLAHTLEAAKKASSLDTRLVMTGSSGCGKSLLMLQAVTYCLDSGWIVLYIPRAHKLVDSTSAYSYDTRTQTYLQTFASHQILKRFQLTNQDVLQSLQVSKEILLERRRPIAIGTTLKTVVDITLNDHTNAPTILSAVLDELEKQTQYPVLLAVDGVQSLYCKTLYKDPHFSRIQPYHMSVPRLIMEYANGSRSFARGGFLGALSMSDTQFPLSLELREALQLYSNPPISPYVKRSSDLVHYTQGLKSLAVPERLELVEAAGIFEMWTKDKALHTVASDELFLAKYTEAAGNARDFVRGGLLAALGS